MRPPWAVGRGPKPLSAPTLRTCSALCPTACRYVEELGRLFAQHAPGCLPAAVAAKGLRVERVGHSVQLVGLPQKCNR